MAEYVMPRVHFRQHSDGRPIPMNPTSHYDELSDTYFIFFYGAPEPSISVDVTETMYAMLDAETEDLIGIQIEAFRRKYIPAHPWLEPLFEEYVKSSESVINGATDRRLVDSDRALATYMVGALMTEGSLTTS